MFITLEGLDGSGKTTQLQRLADALEADGERVVTLRQPGGTPLGDTIREIILDSRTDRAVGGIAPEAELALMFADRAQSLAQIVRPGLEEGAIILCDRYTDSSEAYQGAGRGLGAERVRQTHQAICAGLQPDLTVLLLPPLAASLRRARRRNHRAIQTSGTDENRFEGENDAFYERIHAQYEVIAAREPERVLTFREDASIDVIAGQVLAAVRERLAAHRALASGHSLSRMPALG